MVMEALNEALVIYSQNPSEFQLQQTALGEYDSVPMNVPYGNNSQISPVKKFTQTLSSVSLDDALST
jgi:hypothetical protein